MNGVGGADADATSAHSAVIMTKMGNPFAFVSVLFTLLYSPFIPT